MDKLDTIRRIFVNLAKDSGEDSYKKYLLDIALDMSEPEIKVLIADASLAATITDQESVNKLRSASSWISKVAEVSGLKHDSIVATAEKGLMNTGLVSGRIRGDGSGTDFIRGNGRLTSTGRELYELMQLDDDPLAK